MKCGGTAANVHGDMWHMTDSLPACLLTGAGLKKGGDFSFSELGLLFQCMHSDVYFFNPWRRHSCTEPHPNPGGSRIFISFYVL